MWLSNTARNPIASTKQERERRSLWLRGKAFGPPKASDKYTSDELYAMGMIGVYDPTKPDDIR